MNVDAKTGIHVSLVDDDEAVRKSLTMLIQAQGLRVESYEDCQDFLKQDDILHCCCLILDVRLQGISGLQLQNQLNDTQFVPPIIFISGHADVPTAVRAMKYGAIDFLQKPFSEQILLDRMQNCIEIYYCNHRELIEQNTINARYSLLTIREKEVLNGICDGDSNKIIADKLRISVKTVEQHRSKVMEKMRAGSIVELVKIIERYKVIL
jgi:two-component system, LuxR family, response regulator FixJ